MKPMSLKMPSPMMAKLEAAAIKRGQSKSAVVRDCLENELNGEGKLKGPSCADLMGDLIGSVEGPGDLSTNPKYLREAILEDAARERKNRR